MQGTDLDLSDRSTKSCGDSTSQRPVCAENTGSASLHMHAGSGRARGNLPLSTSVICLSIKVDVVNRLVNQIFQMHTLWVNDLSGGPLRHTECDFGLRCVMSNDASADACILIWKDTLHNAPDMSSRRDASQN